MRILYIEDNPTNVALINRVIQMSGDELHTFDTAEDALEKSDISSFDVIITDIFLGENLMDGLDFTATLRERGVTAPIIAITAYDFDAYERRSMDAGSDFYLVKPIAPVDIVNLLNNLRN
jgi:two-component system, NarL family, capsular synthesis sensor histidine kinase RcsC